MQAHLPQIQGCAAAFGFSVLALLAAVITLTWKTGVPPDEDDE